MARLSAGQHFGEMALIDEERRSATVEAVERYKSWTLLVITRRGDAGKIAGESGLSPVTIATLASCAG